jgi:hypothetical protein
MKTIQIQKVNNILKFIIALLLPYQTLVPFMSAKCMYMQYTHSEFIVKMRETKTVNANTIDRSSLSEIEVLVDDLIYIKNEMKNINKYDTNDYDLFPEIISKYRKQKTNLETKIREWNLKNEFKLDQSITDHIEEYEYDKLFMVEKIYYRVVQDNEVISLFDSVSISKKDDATIYYVEVRDSKNNKVIFTDSMNVNEQEEKYNCEILNSVLYEYGGKKAKDFQVSLPISITIRTQNKTVSKRKFVYKQEYPPIQSQALIIPEESLQTENDTLVLQKRIDSLQTLFEKYKKGPPFVLFKIIVAKSISTLPKQIYIAQSIKDSLDYLISSFNVADSSLELLKELAIQFNHAVEKYDKSIKDWTDIYGEGFPEDISYSQVCISENEDWYVDRDKLVSFDIIGLGKNIELEVREKGTKYPFMEYSLGDIDGEVSFDELEFNRDLLSYLTEESSMYNSEYSTEIEFIAKRKGKLISKFTITVRATVG